MGVFILFSLGLFYRIRADFLISSGVCFLLLVDLYPLDTLTLAFCIFNFVNLMTMLLRAIV